MEIGGVNVLVAFLAGLVSCISPCVLPLAPIYVGNLAGGAVAVGVVDRRAPVGHALAFMVGFILLFTTLGVSVGLVGYALQDHLRLIERIGGVVLIAMGLHMAGIIEFKAFYRGLAVDWDARLRNSYARSFVAGMVISAGWLPCVGPTLGAILTLAVASGTAAAGGLLLLVYSLGLGMPFLATGLGLSRVVGLTSVRRRLRAINVASSFLLAGLGTLFLTNQAAYLASINAASQRLLESALR